MSGGIAYVLDEEGDFETRVNPETVDLDPMDAQDLERVQRLVRRHFQYTRSRARRRRAAQVGRPTRRGS